MDVVMVLAPLWEALVAAAASFRAALATASGLVQDLAHAAPSVGIQLVTATGAR